MKKIGIFYGSSTGYTADVAARIASALDVRLADVYNVATTPPSKIGDYDLIILGSSTWGDGDVQDDFADFLDGIAAMDLADKQLAIFGCGDQTMSQTFCNAVGAIYRRMKGSGAKIIGAFDAEGYDFENSAAEVDGKFVGLVLDEINHPDLTDGRIRKWANMIK